MCVMHVIPKVEMVDAFHSRLQFHQDWQLIYIVVLRPVCNKIKVPKTQGGLI